MEGMPQGIDFNEVKRNLCEIEGVRELHNMRIWSLTMNKTAVSVHLALGNLHHFLLYFKKSVGDVSIYTVNL